VTAQGTRLPVVVCGEQNSAAPAQNQRAAKKGSLMTSQDKPKSFMQELDEWSESLITQLIDPDEIPVDENFEATIAGVKKAIRDKVLESYHNGQKAGPRKSKTYARD